MATEVIATFGGALLDAAHLAPRRRTRRWWLAAAAFATLGIAGAIATGVAVHDESRARDAWTKPAWAYRPHDTPWLAELAALAGLLGAAVTGAIAARRVRSSYWIGEGGDVPVGPAERFALVDDAGVHLHPSMHVVGGTPALPIELSVGRVRFRVAKVPDPPRVGRARAERPVALAMGAGAAIFLAAPLLWDEPPSGFIDLAPREDVEVHVEISSHEDMPARAPDGHGSGDDRDDDKPGGGTPMAGAEGATGMATTELANGHIRIAPTDERPAVGMLDSQALSTGIRALTAAVDFTSGFDSTTVYASQFGGAGEDRGTNGFGISGESFGGGGNGALIGTGTARFYGSGNVDGNGWGEHGSIGAPSACDHGRCRLGVTVTRVRIENIDAVGIDPMIVRRYLRRLLPRFDYCFDKLLLDTPASEGGTLMIATNVQPDGRLVDATAIGVDPQLSACVLAPVKELELPRVDGEARFDAAIAFHPR